MCLGRWFGRCDGGFYSVWGRLYGVIGMKGWLGEIGGDCCDS